MNTAASIWKNSVSEKLQTYVTRLLVCLHVAWCTVKAKRTLTLRTHAHKHTSTHMQLAAIRGLEIRAPKLSVLIAKAFRCALVNAYVKYFREALFSDAHSRVFHTEQIRPLSNGHLGIQK